MNQRSRGAGIFALLAFLCVAAPAGVLAADNLAKVTFRSCDEDKTSGTTVEYQVSAAGPKALVTVTYVTAAGQKTAGSQEHMIFDFKQGTVTWLYHATKTFEVRQIEGLRNVPLCKLIELLRAQAVEVFKKTAGVKGTMYEAKTVATRIVMAEKDAKFKPDLVNIPANYKEYQPATNNLTAGQPGSQSSSNLGFTAPGGSPIGGGATNMPGQ